MAIGLKELIGEARQTASQTLMALGYEKVNVIEGGLNAWAEAGLPTEESS